MILLKYWLEVSPEEQTRRLEARINDGRKIWKLTPMDLKSYSRWYDYSRARDEMFKRSDTEHAPWLVADSNDKRRARLNIITDLLSRIPYEDVKREKVDAAQTAETGQLRRTELSIPAGRRTLLRGRPLAGGQVAHWLRQRWRGSGC